jgi:Cft2 family RNA processing exonuclease
MLKVTPLGGLGEVGMNAMVLEHAGERVLVDCGVRFPRPDQLGIDVVVPDFTSLRDEPDRLKAVVLTHAHEDHLGALSFLLREWPVPVYGTPFTLALARHRLEEAGLSADLRQIGPGEAFAVGDSFSIEPVQVTHSVPDAVGTCPTLVCTSIVWIGSAGRTWSIKKTASDTPRSTGKIVVIRHRAYRSIGRSPSSMTSDRCRVRSSTACRWSPPQRCPPSCESGKG